MKAIILAAGYATRLYPLTRNFPKPLLTVGGKTILNWLMEQIATVSEIDHVVLVTNHVFARHFQEWNSAAAGDLRIEIVDDGTTTNENRLGAVGDIALALQQTGMNDDVFIAAADNILQFRLNDFAEAFRERRHAHVCARHVESLEAQQRTGIAVLGPENRILGFQEKPKVPKSSWGVPPLYLYPRETLPRIGQYLAEGGNPDAPGNFLEWLIRHEPLYAWKMEGTVMDIGNLASLEAARQQFPG